MKIKNIIIIIIIIHATANYKKGIEDESCLWRG